MILLYFLIHLNMLTCFANICPVNTRTKMSALNLVVTESHHLVELSTIMKVLFLRNKRENFYIHYVTGVLAYIVISRHFILKSSIWKLSSKRLSKNNCTPNVIDSCIK